MKGDMVWIGGVVNGFAYQRMTGQAGTNNIKRIMVEISNDKEFKNWLDV
ncbi:MAG: hypothetical protein QM492_03060 [Rhodobacterales bacterium]